MNSSDNINHQVLKTIRQIIRAVDIQSKKLVKRFGLTGPQLVIIKELENGQEISIGDLAKNVSLSQATVTNIIERLETKGYVTRIKSSQDKRRVIVKPTDKIQSILDQNPSLFQDYFIKRFNNLKPWEKNLLLSSLQRIAAMMNAEDIEAQPVLVSGPLSASSKNSNEFFEDE